MTPKIFTGVIMGMSHSGLRWVSELCGTTFTTSTPQVEAIEQELAKCFESQKQIVLIYRYPWEVADSLQRTGLDEFLRQPALAYNMWLQYHTRLLNFYQAHSAQCLLISTNALSKKPQELNTQLQLKFGLKTIEPNDNPSFHPELFHSIEGPNPLIKLLEASWPEIITLLKSLDAHADISLSDLWHTPSPPSSLLRPDHPQAHSAHTSIIIPSYDQGLLLLEAVASVERYAPQHTELLIVDDGSQDERTQKVLEALSAQGYFVQKQNHTGLIATLNTAVELAHGRYILILAHDNLLCPGFIEAAQAILEQNPMIGVVYGNRYDFGAITAPRYVPDFDLDQLLFSNYIDACAVFRKQVWVECGGYDPAVVYEDWEFWLNAAHHGWQFHKLDQFTYQYRIRPNSLRTQVSTRQQLKDQMSHLLHKHSTLYLANDRWRTYLSEAWSAYFTHSQVEQEIKYLETQLEAAHLENKRLKEATQQIEAQLSALYKSKSWRLLSYYWKIRKMLGKR